MQHRLPTDILHKATSPPLHPPEVAERFWAKVDRTGDCWLWSGSTSYLGYGQFKAANKMRSAHRMAWELEIGPIPDGVELDHDCHNRDQSCNDGNDCLHRRCVNPAHLVPSTHKENTLRGRSFSAENARKTHCPQGHEYTPENTMMINPGRGRPRARRCRKCNAARSQANQAMPQVRAQRNAAQNARLKDPEYRKRRNALRRARAAFVKRQVKDC